jgi:sensor histidine kinase YesM
MKSLLYLLLVCGIFCAGNTFAQQDTLHVSAIPQTVSAFSTNKVRYLLASRDARLEQISKQQFLVRQPAQARGRESACWAKLYVRNDTSRKSTLYFFTGGVQYVQLHILRNGSAVAETLLTGIYTATKKLQYIDANYYVSVAMEPGETVLLYMRLYNRTNRNIRTNFTIQNQEGFYNAAFNRQQETRNETYLVIIFCSSLLFLLLFMLFTYIKNGQRIYLYYSIYLFGAIVYSATRLNSTTLVGSWINYFPYIRTLLNEPSQFLFFAFYNLFAIELLNMKERDRWLYKFVKGLSLAYIIYGLFDFTFMLLTGDAQTRDKLFVITRIILFPLNAALIIRTMFTCRSAVYKYFLFGVSVYFLGALIAAISDYHFRTAGSYGFPVTAGNIFQMSIMTEALCFAFALGYRAKIIEEEREQHEQNYIRQLELNQAITEKLNIQLIQEKKISELENIALRSQMNPHFLFNSLNAIKFFVMSGKSQLAANYLNRFSRLIRLILEHSKESLISLQDELTALKLYLEIESTRFDDSFRYQIEVAGTLDTERLMIPPLLLQPYVENAIWHGLLPKKEGLKELWIDIVEGDGQCIIRISDNGIGRAKAARRANNKNHRSYGSKITQERIDLFNSGELGNIKINYIDLPEDAGTVVEITYHYE